MNKNFWRENLTAEACQEMEDLSISTTEAKTCTIAAKQPAKDIDTQLQYDLQNLAETAQGRRFLKYLLEMTGVFEAMPVGNKELYAYCEGKRSIGLMLYHRLYAINPQYIVNIQGEY